jgi:hypothetical protein
MQDRCEAPKFRDASYRLLSLHAKHGATNRNTKPAALIDIGSTRRACHRPSAQSCVRALAIKKLFHDGGEVTWSRAE